jgi:hypothetical protein
MRVPTQDLTNMSSARAPIRVTPLPRPGRRASERRRNRSSSAGEALELALSAAAHESQLDVVLIADDFGMLVASSHTALDLEMLAAITPIVSRGRPRPASAQRRAARVQRQVDQGDGRDLHIAARRRPIDAGHGRDAERVTVARRLRAEPPSRSSTDDLAILWRILREPLHSRHHGHRPAEVDEIATICAVHRWD